MHENSLKPGTTLSKGQFVIDRLIAKGGFSFIYEGRIIYKITHPNELVSINVEEKNVVIKELYISDKSYRSSDGISIKWNDENNPDVENRLSTKIKHKTINEGHKLRLLSSPYILKIIGAIDENNTIYLITEKIEGAIDFYKKLNLSQEQMGKKLPLNDALRYITQVSEALIEVHSKNIVHLDIKPENILCNNKDEAILIDFGISMTVGEDAGKSTILSAASRPWAPPEQYNIKDTTSISFATDIYSLGQTLYVFLTGVIPPDFSSITSGSEILAAPSGYNREVSDYLDEVVMKCLQIRRDKRYQTIGDFLTALKGEKEYLNLIEDAKKCDEKQRYEEGIHLLNKSEKYIPLTNELWELRLSYQNSLSLLEKEDEIKIKEKEADQLFLNGEYQTALKVFELLPVNSRIQKKIDNCKLNIESEKKINLIRSAEKSIVEKDFENALYYYLEAKIVDQSDISIDKKIEELQGLLSDIEKNKKYNEFISTGDKFFDAGDFKQALEAYLKAKENVTISPFTVDKKINNCVIEIEKIKELEIDKKRLLQAVESVIVEEDFKKWSIFQIDERIGKLKETLRFIHDFKKKHPSEQSLNDAIDKCNEFNNVLHDLSFLKNAQSAFDKNQSEQALSLLDQITTSYWSVDVNQLKTRINEKNSDDDDQSYFNNAEVSLAQENYNEALLLLDKIKNKTKFNVEAKKTEIQKIQEEVKEAKLEQDIKDLININDFEQAVKSISLLNSNLKREKYKNAINQQKIDNARMHFNKKEFELALACIIGVDDESAIKLRDDITKAIKEQEIDVKIRKAERLKKNGNYAEARKILIGIDISSDSNFSSRVTNLLVEIFNEENSYFFNSGQHAFNNQKFEDAIDWFKKISRDSVLFNQAKSYILKSQKEIKNNEYKEIIKNSKGLIQQKQYKRAKQLLEKMPSNTAFKNEQMELLAFIHKKTSQTKIVKIIGLSVVTLFLLFYFWGGLLKVNPQELKQTADSLSNRAREINTNTFPYDADSVVVLFGDAIEKYTELQKHEEYKNGATEEIKKIQHDIDQYIKNNENDMILNMDYYQIYGGNIRKLQVLKNKYNLGTK